MLTLNLHSMAAIRITRISSDSISQAIRQALFRRDLDADMAALTFVAFHNGVLHQWVLNRNHLDGEAYMHTFRQILLHGLVKICCDDVSVIVSEVSRNQSEFVLGSRD